jgi:hypothetical protein
MLATFLLRTGLWTVGTVLGGVGVFCAIRSFSTPAVAADAVILIGAAMGINYSLNR